ncbi:unnamed protein product [Vitrella brassicaformis CCMP3155]|uniref:Poly(A) RNA polymerase mitochondrial-like central palm domain-containing protein n=1 Tax=Vitrella brassicaformis (strain CCMP3155) TaxID=1169540 RepID=A0A0G4E8S3_VITBC|nr:unnamed protein product [Vitrella brassicaformis CCMP3155]|eukprot:CEL91600.1 unnamed protein product [Vitrella brassicaformis CCMP3155]
MSDVPIELLDAGIAESPRLRQWLIHMAPSSNYGSTVQSVCAIIEGCVVEWGKSIGLELDDKTIQCKAFGGAANGMATKTSDVDVTLLISLDFLQRAFPSISSSAPEQQQQQQQRRRDGLMRDLSGALLEALIPFLVQARFTDIARIFSAKVPILKMAYSGTEVDLSVNSPMALDNTMLIRTYCDCDIYGRVKHMGRFVKEWARLSGLTGTLDLLKGYGLSLMVIYFLQNTVPPILPNLHDDALRFVRPEDRDNINIYRSYTQTRSGDPVKVEFLKKIDCLPHVPRGWLNTDNLDTLILQFFRFYGLFNWREHAVSVRRAWGIYDNWCSLEPPSASWKDYEAQLTSPARFSKKGHLGAQRHEDLKDKWLIEDPFDPLDNHSHRLSDGAKEKIMSALQAAGRCQTIDEVIDQMDERRRAMEANPVCYLRMEIVGTNTRFDADEIRQLFRPSNCRQEDICNATYVWQLRRKPTVDRSQADRSNVRAPAPSCYFIVELASPSDRRRALCKNPSKVRLISYSASEKDADLSDTQRFDIAHMDLRERRRPDPPPPPGQPQHLRTSIGTPSSASASASSSPISSVSLRPPLTPTPSQRGPDTHQECVSCGTVGSASFPGLPFPRKNVTCQLCSLVEDTLEAAESGGPDAPFLLPSPAQHAAAPDKVTLRGELISGDFTKTTRSDGLLVYRSIRGRVELTLVAGVWVAMEIHQQQQQMGSLQMSSSPTLPTTALSGRRLLAYCVASGRRATGRLSIDGQQPWRSLPLDASSLTEHVTVDASMTLRALRPTAQGTATREIMLMSDRCSVRYARDRARAVLEVGGTAHGGESHDDVFFVGPPQRSLPPAYARGLTARYLVVLVEDRGVSVMTAYSVSATEDPSLMDLQIFPRLTDAAAPFHLIVAPRSSSDTGERLKGYVMTTEGSAPLVLAPVVGEGVSALSSFTPSLSWQRWPNTPHSHVVATPESAVTPASRQFRLLAAGGSSEVTMLDLRWMDMLHQQRGGEVRLSTGAADEDPRQSGRAEEEWHSACSHGTPHRDATDAQQSQVPPPDVPGVPVKAADTVEANGEEESAPPVELVGCSACVSVSRKARVMRVGARGMPAVNVHVHQHDYHIRVRVPDAAAAPAEQAVPLCQ